MYNGIRAGYKSTHIFFTLKEAARINVFRWGLVSLGEVKESKWIGNNF
jgi:hypothetical protein